MEEPYVNIDYVKIILRSLKVYTFDITKSDTIFYQLFAGKMIKLLLGHVIPKVEDLKGKTYCKFHNSNEHATNKYVVCRDVIQDWIDNGKLKLPEKAQMLVNTDPFSNSNSQRGQRLCAYDKWTAKDDD